MHTYSDPTIDSAYEYCLNMVKSHYENFPVASFVLARHIRYPIAAIYAFARTADDFADEGDRNAEDRIRLLNQYDTELDNIEQQRRPDNKIFIALQHSITRFDLPMQLFRDLLYAFKQDVTKQRYEDIAQVMHYCKHSANPVGRLLLHLHDEASEANLLLSDSICTALQLINFLQDISQDYQENNRIYLPMDEMRQFGVNEEHLRERVCDTNMRKLFKFQVQRAHKLMLDGAPLGRNIGGRFGFQLRLMIAGGLAICKRLDRLETDCFMRPRLRGGDWLAMCKYAIMRQTV